MSPAIFRPTEVVVDLGAIGHNVGELARAAAPASVCVVVKADGYGHGAVPVARAALEAGAAMVAVALVEEGAELRTAGIGGPILVLAEPSTAEIDLLVAHDLDSAVYSMATIAALGAAAQRADATVAVHLKIDTGMHRVGVSPADAVEVAKAIEAEPGLALAGVWTHMPVADELAHPFNAEQLGRFEMALASLREAGIDPPLVHAANSAAALAHPGSRFDLVRCGIAVYGVSPGPELAGRADLRPALTWRTSVAHVQRIEAGEGVSYGWRHRVTEPTWIATLPVGYADGVPRSVSGTGTEVLVAGRRCPIVGTVTMDQIMVDLGDEPVERGAEAVLIGAAGSERVSAEDWAARAGTIGYEIVTRIGARVPRRYVEA